ncbi:toxin Cry1Ac domain D-VI-related protein, partial [Listeria rocourtiae]|uniref:toxin Cry1Ac domain D-VI-related protein n=1 Tax=Listeria rocourtiae TaxID=647910 RepID=UPI003D2F5679
MKMKKLMSVVALTSIIGTSVVTPFNVLATPAAASEQASNNNVTNPNLINLSSEATKLETGQYTLTNWNWISGGNKWTLDEASNTFKATNSFNVTANVTIEDGKSITLTTDATRFSSGTATGIQVGQPIATEIGKEYTFSADFEVLEGDGKYGGAIYAYTESPLTQIASASKGGKTGTLTTTFKATKTSTLPNFRSYADKGKKDVIKYSNISLTKSTAQVAKDDVATQNTAREAVNNLFENKNPQGNITAAVTEDSIANAQNLVDQVVDVTKKAELQADLDKAKAQLADKVAKAQAEKEAQEKAREAVNNLFENKDPNGTITTSITQADITNAQTLINQVTDADKKAALQADLEKAKTQLADKEA